MIKQQIANHSSNAYFNPRHAKL